MPADVTQPYRYGVYVPADQAVGVYRGRVSVRGSLGQVSLPVSVTIDDVTLPATTSRCSS